MAGIGGFGIRVNGKENFNVSGNTSAETVTSLSAYVGDITSISMPEVTVGDIDVSSFDSASNFMEYVGGQKEPGTLDMEVNYVPADLVDAIAAVGEANEVWQLSFPDGSIFKSNGYINKAVGGSTDPNGKISGVLGIKLSGIPTQSTSFTAPAAPAV